MTFIKINHLTRATPNPRTTKLFIEVSSEELAAANKTKYLQGKVRIKQQLK
jgi:hypothetical protein